MIGSALTGKGGKTMKVELRRYPKSEELMWMKECTVGTMGKDAKTPPTSEFVRKLLVARHSPIRELVFSYVIRDVPYWVSVHLVRHHVGFQPYVQSQRNDRQSEYDRNTAPQNQPVTMRVTLNAEALMNLANKRLCAKASPETREVVRQMCDLAEIVLPELHGLLVPACEYNGGVCHEIKPCGKAGNQGEHIV
jgi:thymidylate synthase ThyX